jgi:hypothetical protein
MIRRGLETGNILSIFKGGRGEKRFVLMFRKKWVKGECLWNK